MPALNACPSCTSRYRAFAVADLNRDGRPDIVRLNDWNGQSDVLTLQVFLGNTTGGFNLGWREDKTINETFNAGRRLFQIALSDFANPQAGSYAGKCGSATPPSARWYPSLRIRARHWKSAFR